MRKDTYPKFLDSKDFKKAVKDFNKRQTKTAKTSKKGAKSPKASVSTSETSQVSNNCDLFCQHQLTVALCS
jgi:hypothetical protein